MVFDVVKYSLGWAVYSVAFLEEKKEENAKMRTNVIVVVHQIVEGKIAMKNMTKNLEYFGLAKSY